MFCSPVTIASGCGAILTFGQAIGLVIMELVERQMSESRTTVTSIEGQIREGERICISVPGTKRTFTPKVSGVIPNRHTIWAGGFAPMFKGVRTFELKPRDDSSMDFVMEEHVSGLVLPLVKRSLPNFGPIFEHYAGDLKREAERIS
jgi:hypothetical protein